MAGISRHESKLFTQHAIIAARHEGLNQKELAAKLGLEGSRLSEAKNGTSSILPSTRDEIIKLYGADTARWFMLSDSPPDRDLEWTETGVVASYKFINKISCANI